MKFLFLQKISFALKTDRNVNKSKIFSGYVLVRMELTPELWHLLMEINRVSGFIGGTQKNHFHWMIRT
ncbi:MAG: hypothetical protein Ct9H300mP28_36720 [Pseudomonadota bacterium]|nr:MAG: hypothetical protein Ct9H300mP28_36720 [Pseudomonadota bacterium]